MRIVHVISGLEQGGAEAMLEKLVNTGHRLNPEVEQSVVTLGALGVVGARLKSSGIAVESFDMRLSPGSARSLAALRARLRATEQGTVVQTWLWHADLIGGLCARAAGNRRVVWNLRNSMPAHTATKRTSRAAARLCAPLSHWVPQRIVCNSKAARDAHVAIGYCAARCVVIPNGFDLRNFVASPAAREELRRHWAITPGQMLVGMVARVDPMKDHATFIRAAKQVAAGFPDARFVLVGDGVTRDRSIAALLADTALHSRFILEERRTDIPRIMSALDLFCLASRSEGFPNVLGEAMACGTPVVATDVGDARDILDDSSLVAPAGDAAGLAGCMSRVLQLTHQARSDLGRALRVRVEALFDIEEVWEQYCELYGST